MYLFLDIHFLNDILNENARDRGVSGASFLRNSQFEIGAASSGYRQANPRFAPAIYPSASPFDRCPTCVGYLSPALPSNPTSDSHRLSDSSTCLQVNLQLALATNLPACLPANLRLASPANFPAQPLHRPATCAACRSSAWPSD